MSEEDYFRNMSEFFEYNISSLTGTGKYKRWDDAEERAVELASIYDAFPDEENEENEDTRHFLYGLTEDLEEDQVYDIAEEYDIHRWVDEFGDLQKALSNSEDYSLGE